MVTTRECGCVTLDADIDSCYCSLKPLVQAVGRRYALQVLNVIAARERTRFVEIQSQLGGMVVVDTRRTFARALGSPADPPQYDRHRSTIYEYVLTERGRALRESLRKLFREGNPLHSDDSLVLDLELLPDEVPTRIDVHARLPAPIVPPLIALSTVCSTAGSVAKDGERTRPRHRAFATTTQHEMRSTKPSQLQNARMSNHKN